MRPHYGSWQLLVILRNGDTAVSHATRTPRPKEAIADLNTVSGFWAGRFGSNLGDRDSPTETLREPSRPKSMYSAAPA
ncbi:MAG: hypothetical protein AAFO04_27150 [Cyanobacteria bacterium J06592_8]